MPFNKLFRYLFFFLSALIRLIRVIRGELTIASPWFSRARFIRGGIGERRRQAGLAAPRSPRMAAARLASFTVSKAA
jgi:hypothetical protein